MPRALLFLLASIAAVYTMPPATIAASHDEPAIADSPRVDSSFTGDTVVTGPSVVREYVRSDAPASTPRYRKQGREEFGGEYDNYPIGPLGLWVLPADGDDAGFSVRAIDGTVAIRPRPQHGDRLIAIGETSLADADDDARRAIADACVEAGTREDDRNVTLTFARGDETFESTATMPVGAAWAEDGTDCERTIRLRRGALSYLDDEQDRAGNWNSRLAATNGKVVVSSLAGLAYLAAGDTTREGNRRDEMRSLVRWIDRNVGDDPIDRAMQRQQPGVNWNQTNWAHAIAILFLAALEERDDRSRAANTVDDSLAAICESQTERGGWGHGPGGVNALGYIEFCAITAWCSLAVALAERIGEEPEEGILAAGHEYLRGAVRNGQLGYSRNAHGGGGPHAGAPRTAIGLLAFRAAGPPMDEEDEERQAAMATYVRAHIDDMADSHGGYLLQLVQTALVCRSLGDEAWAEFWEYVRPEIDLAAQYGGRFVPRPTPESRRLGLNNDLAMGDAWASAVYGLILGLRANPDCLPLLTTVPDAAADDEEEDGDEGDGDE